MCCMVLSKWTNSVEVMLDNNSRVTKLTSSADKPTLSLTVWRLLHTAAADRESSPLCRRHQSCLGQVSSLAPSNPSPVQERNNIHFKQSMCVKSEHTNSTDNNMKISFRRKTPGLSALSFCLAGLLLLPLLQCGSCLLTSTCENHQNRSDVLPVTSQQCHSSEGEWLQPGARSHPSLTHRPSVTLALNSHLFITDNSQNLPHSQHYDIHHTNEDNAGSYLETLKNQTRHDQNRVLAS